MSDRRISILCWTGLALFTLYLLWVNHDYYRADTQIPTYDEAWYLETSLHLYHRLTTEGLPGFWDGYHRAFGVKAPLLSVLPIEWLLRRLSRRGGAPAGRARSARRARHLRWVRARTATADPAQWKGRTGPGPCCAPG